jgi:hypothetical protein
MAIALSMLRRMGCGETISAGGRAASQVTWVIRSMGDGVMPAQATHPIASATTFTAAAHENVTFRFRGQWFSYNHFLAPTVPFNPSLRRFQATIVILLCSWSSHPQSY